MVHVFFSADVQAVNKSAYGKPRKPVHWSNMNCDGSEQQIISCYHHVFETMEQKKSFLSHLNVAGVKCLPTSSETSANMNGTKDNDTSADSSEQAPAVLIVPTYFTLLMVITILALAIV